MEQIIVKLGQDAAFDKAVHSKPSVPSASDMTIVTKDKGTVQGRAIACLHFDIGVDGERHRAQYTTTVRLLKMALRILDAEYDDEGNRRAVPSTES